MNALRVAERRLGLLVAEYPILLRREPLPPFLLGHREPLHTSRLPTPGRTWMLRSPRVPAGEASGQDPLRPNRRGPPTKLHVDIAVRVANWGSKDGEVSWRSRRWWPDKSSQAAGQVFEPDRPHKSLHVRGTASEDKDAARGPKEGASVGHALIGVRARARRRVRFPPPRCLVLQDPNAFADGGTYASPRNEWTIAATALGSSTCGIWPASSTMLSFASRMRRL